jgi:hypothetical protein
VPGLADRLDVDLIDVAKIMLGRFRHGALRRRPGPG